MQTTLRSIVGVGSRRKRAWKGGERKEGKSEYMSLNERETDIIVRMRLGEVVTVDEFK